MVGRKCSVCSHEKVEEIDKALLEGVPLRNIVEQYGTSLGATQRHFKNGHIARKLVAIERESRLEYGSSVFEQLEKINRDANTLLDKAMKEATENPNLAIQSMREIRGQLQLLVDIRKALYDIKNVEVFQQEVINTLGELNSKARDKFIKRLKERQGIG